MYSELPGDSRGPPPYTKGDTWGPRDAADDPFLGHPSGKDSGGPRFGGAFPGGPTGGAYGSAAYAGNYDARDLPLRKFNPRPPYFHTVSLCLLIFLPTAICVAISCFMAMLLHQAPTACWTLVAICLGITLVLMAVRSGRSGPNYWFNLGFLCFLATGASVAAGIWNFERNFGVYWAYEGQREYTNLLPSEPALSHLDAGKVTFSADARVDFAHSSGYKDGKMFCVAPIVGSAPSARVEYWATGVDCCGVGNFTCGDVSKREAHSGLVLLEHKGPFGIGDSQVDKFKLAASEAAAAHGLTSSPDALFVQWVMSPDKAQRSYWKVGVGYLVAVCFIYLAVSVVVGVTLHFGRGPGAPRSQRAKLAEGRSV